MSYQRIVTAWRSLRTSACISTPNSKALVPLAGRQRRYQSTGKEEVTKSFKGQLMDSTQQRLERERAEQRRFANLRGESSQGRAAALTFGIRFKSTNGF